MERLPLFVGRYVGTQPGRLQQSPPTHNTCTHTCPPSCPPLPLQTVYERLGHAEVVSLDVASPDQFRTFATRYFAQFQKTPWGMMRSVWGGWGGLWGAGGR